MDNRMKEIGRKMSIRMGLLMSLCLSITGNLASGHFNPVGFIISFAVSSVISIVIGLIIPIGFITAKASQTLKLSPGSIPARCVESLISDIIYTPVITLAMVFIAYKMVMKQSGGMAEISFLPMYLHSLVICFVVGYILIFIFTPILLGSLLSKKTP